MAFTIHMNGLSEGRILKTTKVLKINILTLILSNLFKLNEDGSHQITYTGQLMAKRNKLDMTLPGVETGIMNSLRYLLNLLTEASFVSCCASMFSS